MLDMRLYRAAFLPAAFQGTPIGTASVPAEQARIPFIENTETPRALQKAESGGYARMVRVEHHGASR